ncbi:MAG: hypothetical protein CMB80_00575 [Flammeovirgaceae bacterium]|nr:hypothetical protein [Flammeovirgaceae bacterium]
MPDIKVKLDATEAVAKIKAYQAGKVKALEKLITETGFRIHRLAVKPPIPVNTARLKSSIHPVFYGGGSHKYTDDTGRAFDGSLSEKPSTPLEVIVGTNVEYAFDVESRVPFLNPAFQKAKAEFDNKVSKMFKK